MADNRSEWNSVRDRIADAIASWRQGLGYDHMRDSAEIARLRRIKPHDADSDVDLASAIGTDAFRKLYKVASERIDALSEPDKAKLPLRWATRIRREQSDSGFDSRIAVVAGVLAHAKADTGGRLGKELRQKALSELRFRRLIRLETDAELLREGRRIVRMLDGQVPVRTTARALLFWDAQEVRDLARGYYDADLFGDTAAKNSTRDNDVKDTA